MSGAEQGGSTVRPLIGADPTGPAPEYVELFPEHAPGAGGDPGHPDDPREPSPGESSPRESSPWKPGPADAPRGARRAAARPRRRRRTVLATAAVVAGVGAAALLGRLVTGPGEADRALPAPSASQPRLALPSAPDSDGMSKAPRDAGTPSAPASADGASPSASGSASGTRTRAPAAGTATATAPGGTAGTPTTGSGAVLKPGSRGPEVVTLQRRLSQIRLYDGPTDGKYDGDVKYAVQRYQEDYGVTGDSAGFYGPATRRSLESTTTAP